MDTQNQAPVNGGFNSFSATDIRVQEEDRTNQLYDSEEESDSEDGIDVDASTEPKENNSYRGDTDDESVLQRDDYQCSETNRFQNEPQVRELYLESQKQRSDEAKTFVLGMVMAKGSEFNNGMTFSQLESVFNQEVANRQHEALDINLDDLIRSFLGDPAEVTNCLRDKENFFKNSMFKDVLSYDQGLGTFKPRYPKNCLQELHKHIQADYEKKKQKREERRGKKEPNAGEGSKLQYMVSCNFLMRLILEVGNDRREKKFSWDYVRQHYEAMFNEDSLCHSIYKKYKEHFQLDNYKILNKTTCRDLFGRSGALKFLSSSVFAEKIGYINPGAEPGNQIGQIQVYLKSNQLYTNQELKEAEAKIRELEEKRKKESDKIKKRQLVEESSTVQAAPTSSQMPTPWDRKILEKKAKQVAERLEREKTFVKTELEEDGEPLKLEKPFSFGNFGPPKKPVELAPEKEKLPFKHPTPADSRSQSPPERRPQDRDSDSDTEKRVKEVLYTDDEEEQGKRTDIKVPSKKEEKEPQRTGSSSQHPQVPVQKAAHYFEKTEEEIRQWNERAAAEKNKRPMEDKATDSGSEEELREEHVRYSDDEDEPFKEREFRKNKDRRRDSQTSSLEDPHRRSDPCQKARNIFEKDEEEEEEIRGQSVKWNRPAPEETRNEKERRVEAYARDSQRYRANLDEIKEKESEVKPEIVEGPPNIRSRGDPNNLVNHRPQMPNEKNALHTYMQKSLEEKIRDERDSEEAQRKLRIWQNHGEVKRQKAEQEAAQKEADRQRKLQGRFPSPDGYQGKPYSIFDQPRLINERQELEQDGQRESGFHDGQRKGPGQRHGQSQSQWNERHPQSAYQDGHRQGQYESPWNEGQGQSDHWNEKHGQSSFVTGPEQSKRIERPMRPTSVLPDQRRGSFHNQSFEPSQFPSNRGAEPGSRQGFGPGDQGRGGGFQNQNRENFDTSPTPSFQSKHSDHGFNRQNSGSPRPCQWQPSRQVSPPQSEHGFEPYRPAYHQHHQKQDQYRQDQYSQRGFQNVPTGSQNEGGYRQGPSRENTMFHPQSNQGSYYGGDGGSRTSSVTGDYPGRGPISYSNVDRSEDRKNFIGFIVLYLKMDKNMPNNKTRWSYIQTVISPDYRNPAEIFERADWWNAITEENDQITINFQPKTGDVLFALDV